MRQPSFAPPFWLRNAHVQSFLAGVEPRSIPAGFPWPSTHWHAIPVGGRGPDDPERGRFEAGTLVGHGWWHDGRGASSRPAVVVVHGVGGSSHSEYVRKAAIAFFAAGYHVLRLNMRGAGEGVAGAPSLYHAGLTSDLDAALAFMARDPRVSRLHAMGFSLGGNIVLKAAGQWGDRPPAKVASVATASAPVDLAETSRLVERPWVAPYKHAVLSGLKAQARNFARAHPDRVAYDPRDLPGLRRLRDYDAHVVAPMHGFAGVDDYYARASSGPWLRSIRVPTLAVHAEDDPLVPASTVRAWLAAAAAHVEARWSAVGGHVGWVEGRDVPLPAPLVPGAGGGEEPYAPPWHVAQALAFFAAR